MNESDGGVLLARIRGVRKKLSAELGFLIQAIRIRDNLDIDPMTYNIVIKGAVRGSGSIRMGSELAINPGDVNTQLEGVFPLKSLRSVSMPIGSTRAKSDFAKTAGYTIVDGATVIATHINAILRDNASDLLGHDETREILDKIAQRSPKLIEDLVPDKLSVSTIMQILKNILFESIPIRDMNTIIDTLLLEARARKSLTNSQR